MYVHVTHAHSSLLLVYQFGLFLQSLFIYAMCLKFPLPFFCRRVVYRHPELFEKFIVMNCPHGRLEMHLECLAVAATKSCSQGCVVLGWGLKLSSNMFIATVFTSPTNSPNLGTWEKPLSVIIE